MDLTSIFLFCVISLVIGAVLMILVQYYIYVKFFNQPTSEADATQRNRSLNERYQLPDVSDVSFCAQSTQSEKSNNNNNNKAMARLSMCNSQMLTVCNQIVSLHFLLSFFFVISAVCFSPCLCCHRRFWQASKRPSS